MNLQAEKIELAKMLLETEDQSLLKDIRSLFTRKKESSTTPQFVIDGIKKSQEQFKNSQYLPYEEVKELLDKI
jgi:glutaredoxin